MMFVSQFMVKVFYICFCIVLLHEIVPPDPATWISLRSIQYPQSPLLDKLGMTSQRPFDWPP